jgi:6-phosphogluconate dehydrogenase
MERKFMASSEAVSVLDSLSSAQSCEIGVLGLAVMGANLARNFSSRGFRVAVYNRTQTVTEQFILSHRDEGQLSGFSSLGAFVNALQRPRKIMLMVQAGPAIDAVIAELAPLLTEGDVIIDGGNSFFRDTMRRESDLAAKEIFFLGVGVSGGEEGALKGPSIMPGGDPKAYPLVAELFEKIAARSEQGPCVAHIGRGGSGHFVKMVHNGIEYADMQLLAEAFDVMRRGLGLDLPAISRQFHSWNEGDLQSYLVEITAQIVGTIDPETNTPLIDCILDKAGQKGTGNWTVREALDFAVPVPSIEAAVRARVQSSRKELRVDLSKQMGRSESASKNIPSALSVDAVEGALYFGKILAYAEGIDLMQTVSRHFNWGLNISEIARVWMAGCIIRARLLKVIFESYANPEAQPIHFLATEACQTAIQERLPQLRLFVAEATRLGIAIPAFSAALSNFESLTTARLPQYLTQAQRDFFGAHTFERIDRAGSFHFQWGGE